MDAEASGWPAQRTARELVSDVQRGFQEGNVVSVKATINGAEAGAAFPLTCVKPDAPGRFILRSQ